MILFYWPSFCLRFKVMVSCSILSDDPRQILPSPASFLHSFVIVGQASWNPTSTQFWIYKGVNVVHTFLYIESSFAVFLVLMFRLFRMGMSARSRNAGVVASAVGRPERRTSTSPAWPFAETAIREARLTVLVTTALTPYTFFNRFWMSITDPFAMKNSVTVHCLKRASPYNRSDRSKIVQLGLLNCRQYIINDTFRARVKRVVQMCRTWSCCV